MAKIFLIIAGSLALLGVALGAFGAHALSSHFERFPDLQATYETAARYHIYHALGLFAVAWLVDKWPEQVLFTWAGWLIVAGVVIFCGSLYALALSNVRWLGAITPIGGVAFLSGWLCLILGVWRG